MRVRGRRVAMVLTGLVVLQLAVSWRAEAQINSYWDLYHFWIQAFDSCVRVLSPTLNKALLLKAPIDECFYGVGNPLNQYLATSCPNGRWKRNGGQVWALAKWGDKVWVGTRENAICTTMGFSGVMEPIRTDYAVCEFGQSAFVPPLPDYLGDWRPPSIYVYDVQTGQSRRVAFLTPGSLGGIPLIQGLRGAGAVNGIVFMAGLAGTDSQNASLVLFAYNSDTEEFLGWRALNGPDGTRYKNTRKWLTFKGHLYGSAWVEGGGRIIRWLGDAEAIKKGDVRTLWNFEEVGYLDQAPANMTVYDGKRLAVGTRPKDTNRVLRGGQIWLSPEFQDHLTAQDAFQWKVVWSAAAYEPDTVTAAATAVGDLAFFDGYLWWGTEMQVEQAWGIHKEVYGRLLPGYPSTDQDIAALLGTWRPTSVFRGRHMESENYQVDLLYGFSLLPRFEVNQETGQGRWTLAPNRMGAKPLYGPGGFCNWYQVQTYSMAVFGNRLYVGTSEYSQRMASGFLSLPDFPKPTPSPELWGADLWRFDSAEAGAVAESLGGIGNYLNAAVRNLLADDALYVGTGNTSNLATDPRDDVPEGGWELIRLWE